MASDTLPERLTTLSLFSTLLFVGLLAIPAATAFPLGDTQDDPWDVWSQDFTDTMQTMQDDMNAQFNTFDPISSSTDESEPTATDDVAADEELSEPVTDTSDEDTAASDATVSDATNSGTADSDAPYNGKATEELRELVQEHGDGAEYDTFISIRDDADLQAVADQVRSTGADVSGVHDNVQLVTAWATPGQLEQIAALDAATELDRGRTEYECHGEPCDPPEPVRSR